MSAVDVEDRAFASVKQRIVFEESNDLFDSIKTCPSVLQDSDANV